MTSTKTEDAVRRRTAITDYRKSSNHESAEIRFVLLILLIHVGFCICNRRAFLSPSVNQLTSNSKVQRASSAPEELRSYHQ